MPCTFRTEGPVGVLTLSAPERRNAMSQAIVDSALACLATPEAKRSRALVVTGDGPAFCAGADIGDLLQAGWLDPQPPGRTPMDLFQAIAEDPRIVVAAVNGMALGGGFELVLACDLAVASDEATFCVPELTHGVIPNTGIALLAPLVGRRVAMEMVLSGRRIGAQEAAGLGLVAEVVPRDAVLATALGRATEIVTRFPPAALRALKRSAGHHAPVDWAFVRSSLQSLSRPEWEEGLGAFKTRRTPDYQRFWDAEER